MLAIRMQRTGRKGHAMFRVVVQDSRLTPTSGKVVALLGSFDPHSKTATVDTEKAGFYLNNGAQPSPRAARLLEQQGLTLPEWVKTSSQKNAAVRHPEKLRRNQPKEEAVSEPAAENGDEPEATTEPAESANTAAPADAPEAETGTTES